MTTAPTRKMIRHLNAREREKALNEALKDVSSEDSDESTDDEVVRDEVGKNVKGGGEQSSSEEEAEESSVQSQPAVLLFPSSRSRLASARLANHLELYLGYRAWPFS